MVQENLVALQSILTKEVTRYFRIWIQTLLPPAITMSLYFVIFGNLIGEKIGQMDDKPYIAYITPGIIMMSVITNSYSNVVSSFFSAKFQRHIEELLVSPVPNIYILLGYIGGGVSRGLLTGAIVTGISLFFVDLEIHNWFVVFVVILLTSTLFALGGFINAVFAKKFDDISIVPTFILTPLTYLGGVFYTISLLPEFWQKVSMANPILYMVNAFRYGFLGRSDIALEVAFTIIGIFIVALFSFALYLLNTGKGLKS
ncbi:MAG: ABC transporter permease [Gammaproteobacteria bacterium]|nr:ABC transporter permease [Gammaproteobacteria bacterium]NVK88854.1 ABC transporter permease [Gammaproteobacteria bacterium]